MLPHLQLGRGVLKDAVLNQLAEVTNVAQFVSFAPGTEPTQRYAWLRGDLPNRHFASVEAALTQLVSQSGDGRVNVRSFHPDRVKSSEFVYGISTAQEAVAHVRRLASAGLFTIVNETIEVNDGGVSGVTYGGVCEFAPNDTPRCVEQPGTASLPTNLAISVLRTVYGFDPALDFPRSLRVEFSMHPLRQGLRHEHTIIWEIERAPGLRLAPRFEWPNRFSRHIGDKAFGLLLAHLLGLSVPRTSVVSRSVAPFSFGRPTGTGEVWIRTSPAEQAPGKFTTQRGWTDPFRLLQEEDPSGTFISSVLAQEGVDARHSGALLPKTNGAAIIEGVSGSGEAFMLGLVAPQRLPQPVRVSIQRLYQRASRTIQFPRMEWVHDGKNAWVVQLHRSSAAATSSIVFPGAATSYRRFRVEDGIESLRHLIQELEGRDIGVILEGDVGVTSHIGDLLRRAKIPSRIERRTSVRSSAY